jgi:hypothetical protein
MEKMEMEKMDDFLGECQLDFLWDMTRKVEITKVVYKPDGDPLYLVDSQGWYYPWASIIRISQRIHGS